MSEERGPRGIEWTLLAVMAALAAFAVLATGGIRAVDFAIVEYLMAAALGLSVLRLWVHQQPVFHVSPVLWSVLAFTGYVTWRTFTADIPYLAEDEWTRVLLYTAFFVIFTFHLFRPQYSQALLVVLATVAIGSSLYAAYQYFSGSNKVWHFFRPDLYAKRGSGTFINPNNFAGYVAVLLPMMVAVVMAARVSVTTRFLAGYAALMFMVGLAVSASRGGLLAAGGGLLALIFLLVRQKAFRLPALVLLTVLILSGFAVLSQTTLTQWRLQQMKHTSVDLDSRFLLWQSAEEMWRDHLWLGVGPGHYDAVFPQYRPDIMQQRQPYFAHNEYLNTLADYGLIGALLVLVAIGSVEFAFRHGWQGLRREADNLAAARSNRLALLLGASAGVVAALIHALFDYNFHIPAYALLVIFFLGVMTVAWRTDNARWWWRPQVLGKVVFSVLCLLLAGWFIVHANKRTGEAKLLAQSKRTGLQSPEYPQLLEAARKVEPKNALTVYDLAEHHRDQSWAARSDFKQAGERALELYSQAALLDPHDSYIPLRQAMTLVWIGGGAKAKPYLDAAERLNPKDYFTLAHIGWCHFQLQEYGEAKRYFERSLLLRGFGNKIAETYLPQAEARLQERSRSASPSP
ncbi:MAG: O-antigen ligase family protein [Verrucomicrobiota bacterium]